MSGRRDAVVIVEPILSGAPLVEEARRQGFAVVGVLSLPPAFFTGPMVMPEAAAFDQRIVSDDAEGILDTLARGPFTVRAVFPGAEAGVTLADVLAERLGLRGQVPALRAARRNKFDMKEAARAAGLACARAARCHVEADLDAFVAEVGWPVVLKTPEGAATVQVYRCDDPGTLHTRLREILHHPNLFHAPAPFALIEEYLPGPEIVVNTFTDEGGTFVTDVWRYEKAWGPQGDNLYREIRLADPAAPDLAPVLPYALRLVEAVGIRYGAAHLEIKATPDGPKMVEIAARLAGARMPQLIRVISDFDPYRATVEAFVTGRTPGPRHVAPRAGAAVVVCASDQAGRVRRVHGIEAIRALPSYHGHHLAVAPGGRVGVTTSLHDPPLFVYLVHPDPAALDADRDAVFHHFRLEVDPAPPPALEPR